MVSNLARDMTEMFYVNLNKRKRSKKESLIVAWKDIEALDLKVSMQFCHRKEILQILLIGDDFPFPIEFFTNIYETFNIGIYINLVFLL